MRWFVVVGFCFGWFIAVGFLVWFALVPCSGVFGLVCVGLLWWGFGLGLFGSVLLFSLGFCCLFGFGSVSFCGAGLVCCCDRVFFVCSGFLSCCFFLSHPKSFRGKATHLLSSQRSLQACQLCDKTTTISHHSVPKLPSGLWSPRYHLTKNPQFFFMKFRALWKQSCDIYTLWLLLQIKMLADYSNKNGASQGFLGPRPHQVVS